MQEKKLLWLVLTFILVLPPALTATSVFAVKEPVAPEKTLKGFRGEAKLIARQWLRHEKKFTSLEFIRGEKGRFWNMGLLAGTLADGRRVSIDVENDFSGRNPGLLRDHLEALKFKAETSALSKRQYKALLAKRVKFHKRLAAEQNALEKEIQQKIELRLEEILDKELPAAEKSVLRKMEKAFMPEIRKQIVKEIEDEVKQKFPSASPEKLNFEITSKMNKQSGQRIKKALREKIIAVNLSAEGGTPEMRKFTEKIITYYRPRITAEVRAEYAMKRSRKLGRLKHIARGGRATLEGKHDTFLGKLKGLLGWN